MKEMLEKLLNKRKKNKQSGGSGLKSLQKKDKEIVCTEGEDNPKVSSEASSEESRDTSISDDCPRNKRMDDF